MGIFCVQLTVVLPIGNTEPEGGLQVTGVGVGPSTLSTAVTVNGTLAPKGLVALTTIGFDGTFIFGGTLILYSYLK